MKPDPPLCPAAAQAGRNLQVYLLGTVDFEPVLSFQRRLLGEVAQKRDAPALIICEHPPLITVGRHGSWAHIRLSPTELRVRGWQVRWVSRGGGCLLHMPGQLAIYPIFPLDLLGLGLQAYLDRLQEVFIALLDDFSIHARTKANEPGIWVDARPVAAVGIAVRDWVSYFGAALNINVDLEPFRGVSWGGAHGNTMTSLERERRAPLRPSLVRERLLAHMSTRFQFAETALFFDHPALRRKAPSDAIVTSS
jgi:lipoyl(octanoyl) transferase